ncbi:MAG: FmdE family protein [Candidatus Cloacimonadota bacterium]|nr:FmdE family protein [Candidatus Cloacimonadota bacterium]
MRSYLEAVQFHGHSCPGLAMGYRMTKAALDYFSQLRAEDEELVAIVENDACGTDAVQFLSGCTFGKGNLIFKDYGKMVYTFYNRNSGKAIRISRPAEFKEKLTDKDLSREKMIDWILSVSENEIVKIEEVTIPKPKFARILKTVICEFCGETVTETRVHDLNGKVICIPCFKNNQEGL